jgi:hypothetical protein
VEAVKIETGISLETDGYYIAYTTKETGRKTGEKRQQTRLKSLDSARNWLVEKKDSSTQPTTVDPVLAYVRGMRRDDTTNPGPRGTGYRRGGDVRFQQADAMPADLMRGEFKRAGLSGAEYLEAIIKEYAARFDGQEALAVTMEGESPFLDALAAALDIEVIHV